MNFISAILESNRKYFCVSLNHNLVNIVTFQHPIKKISFVDSELFVIWSFHFEINHKAATSL